jgi:hypothetical protein
MSIELQATSVRIRDFEIPRKDVADYLRHVPEENREATLIHAIEVGIFCLERAQTSQDVEFVRRQVESLIQKVEETVSGIPDKTEKSLVARLGTGEGQVLAPVQRLVEQVAKAANDKLKEVQDLLTQDIDPSKDSTSLGKALRAVRDLLDPKRTDSIQGALDAAVKSITAADGEMANTVKAVVEQAVKPLAGEVDKLAKEVRGREAAGEALAQTTAKGAPFEDEITSEVQAWGRFTGMEVEHVGKDNRPGDIVAKTPVSATEAIPATIVLEVRDRQDQMGRKRVTDCLTQAMTERAADAAIYLSRTRDGLGNDIGEWADGDLERGPYVVCTREHLVTALRFLLVRKRLDAMRVSNPEVDAASIEAHIGRIRTALGKITNINTKAGAIRTNAEEIQQEADALRNEVRRAIEEVESALRAANHPSVLKVAEAKEHD